MRWPTRHPLCPECGYDLAGTVAAGGRRCPECGEPFEEHELGRAPRPGDWTVGRGLRRGAILVLVALAVLALVWGGVLWLLSAVGMSRRLDFVVAAILGYLAGRRLTADLAARAGFQSWLWPPVVVLTIVGAVVAGTLLAGSTVGAISTRPVAAAVFVITTLFASVTYTVMDD